MKQEKLHSFTTVFEPAQEGGYVVHVPALPGCVTEGDTFEQAKSNAKEAIEAYVAALKELKEEVPIESEETIVSRITPSMQ